MTPMETILLFFVTVAAIAVPTIAVLSRKGSVLGQAIADRIRGSRAAGTASAKEMETRIRQLEQRLSAQESEISGLEDKMSFVNRLLEDRRDD